MNQSEIIATIALLVSIASFIYSALAARKSRRIQGMEKRVSLLTNVSKFALLQEQIVVESSRLSRTAASDQGCWESIAHAKRGMAKKARDMYGRLESMDPMDVNALQQLEASINDMVETAKCDLKWLEDARSAVEGQSGKLQEGVE